MTERQETKEKKNLTLNGERSNHFRRQFTGLPHLHNPRPASLASRWSFKKNILVHYPLSESMYLSSNTRESSGIPRNSIAVR